MSDAPAPRRNPLIPPRVPRRDRQAPPMADQPGRDPRHPYVDNRASVASLAKHLRIGLDLAQPTTTVNTRELALILDTMIGAGFPVDERNQYQSELTAAYSATAAIQQKRATEGDAEDASA